MNYFAKGNDFLLFPEVYPSRRKHRRNNFIESSFEYIFSREQVGVRLKEGRLGERDQDELEACPHRPPKFYTDGAMIWRPRQSTQRSKNHSALPTHPTPFRPRKVCLLFPIGFEFRIKEFLQLLHEIFPTG